MEPLVDLHTHLGSSVAPHVLWSIAHERGYKPPVKNYREFVKLVTADRSTVKSLDDYLKILHQWTEKIQSSPAAVERSVYEMICEEYRRANVDLIEVRFNPMKRNGGGERDLDYIITSAIRGMERACMEYPVKAGLIFCMAREFTSRLNSTILEKAIKYKDRGVVGIDLAGPEKLGYLPDISHYGDLFRAANEHGLGTTVHCGEVNNPEGVAEVLERIAPQRLGHGIAAWKSVPVMKELAARGTVLELCFSSNLMTRAVANVTEFREAVWAFRDNGVKVTFNSDGTHLLDTDMASEVQYLLRNDVTTPEGIREAMQCAREHSFIKRTA